MNYTDQDDNIVYMGDESCTDRIALWHERLDEAFAAAGLIQQPCHCESESEHKVCQAQIQAANQEIIKFRYMLSIALTGRVNL